MCQLLGMNCNKPASISFSFEGFCCRGGQTDEHSDGWGIAFFEEKGCRLIIDDKPSITSPLAELVKRNPVKSCNVIAHIRKATQGPVALENSHPFRRELWGRTWVFAHNGHLKTFAPDLFGAFLPVGATDSERAFCYLLQSLKARFGDTQPAVEVLHEALQALAEEIATHGVFNFLLSNGEVQFAHCSTLLHYVTRQYPFAKAHLVDCELSMDFNEHNHLDDCITVIATKPLTSNENWVAFAPGELKMFRNGVEQGAGERQLAMAC
ncbi:class II glutamine amidotransferase [Uliginosibacterium sp. H3]|uniref:Class II glutamine amidotransferase n=1 Tax=Uliginosibacterium silvisoli TaxID=3114758 RepID=A0ABU6K4P1_9RHOO|nr:class II glutamine amidotransferase [Uliginosibacterium sp. H3]